MTRRRRSRRLPVAALAVAVLAVAIGAGVASGLAARATSTGPAAAARTAAAPIPSASAVPSATASPTASRPARSALGSPAPTRTPTGSAGAPTPAIPSASAPAPAASGSGSPGFASEHPTIAQLIGQKLVVRMDGSVPSTDLLGRIRRGEVGGVVLFGPNLTTPDELVRLTATLHAAATAGGHPRLLIAIDQEGGSVKRIPWAPPTVSPPQIGADGSNALGLAEGAATGAALRTLGIDVDLAPVADVPASTSSFMGRAGRTFSFDAVRTARLANAFASGLRSSGVIPTLKHFPGIGRANRNTDIAVVTIDAARARLASGLLPYRTAVREKVPLIMLSNATYPAYDPLNGAGWSAAIVGTLLRHDLGYTGATITDGLDGTAHARGTTPSHLATLAAAAGTDLILTTGTEPESAKVFASLVAAAESGAIPLRTLEASYARILALKAGA